MQEPNKGKFGLTTLRELITTDSRNTPSTKNHEEKEIVETQETMVGRRCRKMSNDLIHGGRW